MNPIIIFLNRPRVFLLSLIFITLSGLFALNSLPRQENPELAQRWSIVKVEFPGASPARIETLILEPLEAKLREVFEVRRLISNAYNGYSTSLVEIKHDVDPALIEDVWSEVQDKIDQSLPLLPIESKVELIRSSGPPTTLLYGIVWNGLGDAPKILMTRVATDLKQKLAFEVGTEKAFTFGGANEEILIEVDNNKLSNMGISLSELSNLLSSADNKKPIGTINNDSQQILVKSLENFRTLDEIKSIPIKVFNNTEIVTIGDVASITKAPRNPVEEIILLDGEPTVLVEVRAAFRQRIDDYVERVDGLVKQINRDLPQEIVIQKIYDESSYLESRFSGLSFSVIFAIAIVIGVSYLLLGLRSAIIVGTTIPLAIFLVLFGCNIIGLPLHQTSITGIIIALGLLIDNAIIMVEDYKFRRRSGNAPRESALKSFNHLWVPLAAATATTVLAFLPIASGKGPSTEFVGGMAVTVIFSITSSFLLALFVTPVLLNYMEKIEYFKDNKLALEGYSNAKLRMDYKTFLTWCFDKPHRGIMLSLILPTIGFLSFPFIDHDFFPELDRNMFRVIVELPPNSSIELTEKRIQKLRESIYQEADFKIESDTWYVGRNLPRILYNVIGGDTPLGNNHVADAFFISGDYQSMKKNLPKLAKSIVMNNPDIKIIINKFDSGPPVFASIEYRLMGDNTSVLRELGSKLELILSTGSNVYLTKSELSQTSANVQIKFDESKLSVSNINNDYFTQELSIATQGKFVGTMLDGNKEIPVRIRGQRYQSIEDVIKFIVFPNNSTIDFAGSYGDLKLSAMPSVLTRFKGVKQNGIQAWIWPGELPSATEISIKKDVQDFINNLPQGYSIEVAGEAAERSESRSQIFSSATIFFILIGIALISALNSFRETMLILSVAIMCLGLAFIGLVIGQANFGFMSLVGAVGLIGLSINDSIIVLSHLKEQNSNKNINKKEIVDVVIRSSRHIFTTSLTTFGGLLPVLIFSVLYQPLAWAMAAGVLGATFTALLYIPSMYIIKIKIN